jgi:transcriptional antiterminator NusG
MSEELEKEAIEEAETKEEAAEEVTSAEEEVADEITSAEEEVADEITSAEEEVADEITPAEEEAADEIAPAEEEAADEIAPAEEEAADEITSAEDSDDDDAIEVLPFDEDGRAWYVVHCYSGYENKVRHSIEQRIETMGMQDKIFDVVVPTEEEIEIKDGKRRTVERRVFPGYILVQLIMDEDSWYVVRNTPGVTGFVGMGNEPTPLRSDEVAKIMNRMEAEAPKVKFNFQPGEKVRIRSGPFSDFIGTVDEIDVERAKVKVLVSFFGRETPVELDFLHVENV